SKVEAGRMPMRLLPHRAPDLVSQAVEAMRPVAGKAGVRLQGAGDDAVVSVDADLVIRVLQNLISNAIKYSPAGTLVRLDARTSGERVTFTVDDQGPGIPADQLPFLFRPFSRVAGHEYDRETGTGLGLAISRAIVEQHHGRIWAQALPEGGSRGRRRTAFAPTYGWRPSRRSSIVPCGLLPLGRDRASPRWLERSYVSAATS